MYTLHNPLFQVFGATGFTLFSSIYLIYLFFYCLFVCWKLLILSIHSPMWLNAWNFHKQTKKRQISRKIAVKKGSNANFEKRSSLILSWYNAYLNSNFQAALMFDGWVNREQTYFFLFVYEKPPEKCLKNWKFSIKKLKNVMMLRLLVASENPNRETNKIHVL